jgi:hypothetical protein
MVRKSAGVSTTTPAECEQNVCYWVSLQRVLLVPWHTLAAQHFAHHLQVAAWKQPISYVTPHDV